MGTATLAWTAPETNTDGSLLTDLAGFKVHYGTTSGYHPQTIDVGAVTTYQVANLSAGATYYFVVTAYNQAGVESDPSSEVSKMIN
jgi:fibronectin type 3 domain-containing protein